MNTERTSEEIFEFLEKIEEIVESIQLLLSNFSERDYILALEEICQDYRIYLDKYFLEDTENEGCKKFYGYLDLLEDVSLGVLENPQERTEKILSEMISFIRNFLFEIQK